MWLSHYLKQTNLVFLKTLSWFQKSLKKQQKSNGTIHDAIINEKTINENLPISEFISDIANNIYPTAVIDDKGKYKGTISKSRLLKVFDEGVDNE